MPQQNPIQFQMIGGFLGAGKTTALGQLAAAYQGQGRGVGIVTNDQSNALVDTESLRSQGFPVGEVAGACFCCNFDDLMRIVRGLSETQMPDILLAEPVGSCTDLVATVAEPIRRLFHTEYSVAPFVVLLKPEHGLKILCGQPGGFSPQAEYIFLKQLEEADVIAINKIDKLSNDQLASLTDALRERYPAKPVIPMSARDGRGIDDLMQHLSADAKARGDFMQVDYDTYAEGEAQLGWLNADYAVTHEEPLRLADVAIEFLTDLTRRLAPLAGEIAHLKIRVSGANAQSVANVVCSHSAPEISVGRESLARPERLILNARIAVDPQQLATSADQSLAHVANRFGLQVTATSQNALRPGRPVPTHRILA